MADLSSIATTLRADGYKTRLFVSTPPEDEVLRGTITGVVTEPVLQLSYTNVSGSHSDVIDDTEAEIFASGVSKGRVRVAIGGATSSVIQIEEVSQGRIQIVVGDQIRVYRSWRQRARLVAASEDFERDGRVVYSNQNAVVKPVANGGGARASFINSTTSVATFSFSAADSFAVDSDSGGTLTYVWDVDDGTITVGTSTSSSITATFPAGKRWISLTVTDSSNSATDVVYIPVIAAEWTGVNAPLQVTIDGRSGSVDDGWTFDFSPFDSAALSALPDGSMVIVWAFEDYGSTQASYGSNVSGNSNIKFVGYLRQDTSNSFYSSERRPQTVSFSAVSPLALLNETVGFAQVLEIASSPANWLEYRALTVKQAIIFLLRWCTTALNCHDFVATFQDFDYPSFFIQENVPAAQIKELADAVDAIFTCDKNGRYLAYRDLATADTTTRDAATTMFTLTADDIVSLRFTRQHRYEIASLEVRGFSEGTTEESVAALFSVAPGVAPADAPQRQTAERLILASQNDLNARAGRRWAKLNRLLNGLPVAEEVEIRLRGGYDVFDFYGEWMKVTLASSYNARGVTFNSTRFLIQRIASNYDTQRRASEVVINLVQETDGIEGTTLIQDPAETDNYGFPDLMLDVPTLTQPVEFDFLTPILPSSTAVPLNVYTVGTVVSEIGRISSFDYTDGTGTYDDLDASNTTTGNPRWAWSDPHSYKRFYVLTTAGLWKTDDKTVTNPSWTLVANNATIFGNSANRGYYGEMSINRQGYIIIGGGTKSCAVSFDYGATWTRTAFDNGSTNFDDTESGGFVNGMIAGSYYNSRASTTNGWVYAIYANSSTTVRISLNRGWGAGTWETVATLALGSGAASVGQARIYMPYRRAGGAPNKNDDNQVVYYSTGSFDFPGAWGAVRKDGTTVFAETGASFGNSIAKFSSLRPFNIYTQDGSKVYAIALTGVLNEMAAVYSENAGADFVDGDMDAGDPLVIGSWGSSSAGNVNGWGSNPDIALIFSPTGGGNELQYTPDNGATFYDLSSIPAYTAGVAYAEFDLSSELP